MLKKSGPNSRDKMLEFRRTVLAYYRERGRHGLPWRKTHDPYAILVSEVMLQQTQVDRVIPYFERWMKKFPTPEKLAGASLTTVLREWSGLGYNRRAKYLQDAAKAIVKRGGFPRGYEELRKLSGVGEYTAKAVRVFAFNEPEALIETNVRAVFLHHFFPRSRHVTDARLLPLIATAVDLCKSDLHKKTMNGSSVKPREWYAALMDYGSFLKSQHPNPSRRSKHYTTQSKFEGSLRQVRGAILKAISRGEDIKGLRNPYIQHFDEALASLVRDGLVTPTQSQESR